MYHALAAKVAIAEMVLPTAAKGRLPIPAGGLVHVKIKRLLDRCYTGLDYASLVLIQVRVKQLGAIDLLDCGRFSKIVKFIMCQDQNL